MYRRSYFPGRGSLLERHHLMGEAGGSGVMVLRLLELRGVAVSEDDKSRVHDCNDLDLIDLWFDRAFTAATIDEVFLGRGTLEEESETLGRIRGHRYSVLRTLELREVVVSEAAKLRVLECTDLDTLNVWFDRAITAQSTAEVFSDRPA